MKKKLFLSMLVATVMVSTFSYFNLAPAKIEASNPIINEETVTGTVANSTTVSSAQLQGGVDQFYVATVANYQNKAVSGVSGLGLTWTQAVNQCSARNAQGLQIWYAKGSPSSADQVTATFGVSTQVGIISVSRYSGVDSVVSFIDQHGENHLGVNGPCTGGVDSRPAKITMNPTTLNSVKVVAVNSRTRSLTAFPSTYTKIAGVQSGTSGAATVLSVFNSSVTTVASDAASFDLSGTTDWATAGLILQPSAGETDPDPVSTPVSVPVSQPEPEPDPEPTDSVVLVGAGNISKCTWSTDELTANLLDSIPGTVFTLGDHAYEDGTTADFNNCYNPSWGRHKERTKPTVGNHDYQTAGAAGYYNYFGAAAGDPTKGYYSYDLGNWHIVVLNSNCGIVPGGCKKNSPQDLWLQADLAANPKSCTLAMWHHASFSSSGGTGNMRYLWNTLYNANADVVLTAHQHLYERFAPQTGLGVLDNERGLRQFVVGTGGANLTTFDYLAANSEVRNNETHGVLKMTLNDNTYDWEFVPVAGQTFTDSGTASCH
jgi:hypothetical protein